MLHPIVINPEFLMSAKDDDKILDKFSILLSTCEVESSGRVIITHS